MIDSCLLPLDWTTLIHTMAVFKVEGTPIEFVVNVDEDEFVVVHEH